MNVSNGVQEKPWGASMVARDELGAISLFEQGSKATLCASAYSTALHALHTPSTISGCLYVVPPLNSNKL